MKKATPKNYYILIILIIPAKKGKKLNRYRTRYQVEVLLIENN